MVVDNLSYITITKNYCISFYGNENRYIYSITIRNLLTYSLTKLRVIISFFQPVALYLLQFGRNSLFCLFCLFLQQTNMFLFSASAATCEASHTTQYNKQHRYLQHQPTISNLYNRCSQKINTIP